MAKHDVSGDGGRGGGAGPHLPVEASLADGLGGVVVGAELKLEGPAVVLGYVHLHRDFLQQVNR